MTLPVRVYTPADQDGVIALWQRCGLTRPWNDPAKDIARKLTVQPELFGVVQAPEGQGRASDPGQIIGSVMAGYEGHRGWVNYLAVDPAWQRHGLGRQLMAWAEAGLRALGCPKINLQIRLGNEAAVAFYQRIGFLGDEVVCMGKRLEAD
jgi:ribosomal protein S18 acetylase RimI-like enzyme